MALQPIQGVTERWKEDADGDLALVISPGATVAVYNEETGALAPLFAERDGLSGLPNPFTSDKYGRFSCYTEVLRVKIKVTTAAGEIGLFRNVPLLNELPKALVKLTSAQSVANTVLYYPDWDEAVYDTDSIWDAGQPKRLTCPIDGYVQLTMGASWAISSVGLRYLRIDKNGSTGLGGANHFRRYVSIAESEAFLITPVVPVVAGDYFEALYYQDTGGNLDLGAVGFGSTCFGLTYVR